MLFFLTTNISDKYIVKKQLNIPPCVATLTYDLSLITIYFSHFCYFLALVFLKAVLVCPPMKEFLKSAFGDVTGKSLVTCFLYPVPHSIESGKRGPSTNPH